MRVLTPRISCAHACALFLHGHSYRSRVPSESRALSHHTGFTPMKSALQISEKHDGAGSELMLKMVDGEREYNLGFLI